MTEHSGSTWLRFCGADSSLEFYMRALVHVRARTHTHTPLTCVLSSNQSHIFGYCKSQSTYSSPSLLSSLTNMFFHINCFSQRSSKYVSLSAHPTLNL